jgi:hypothetical protein
VGNLLVADKDAQRVDKHGSAVDLEKLFAGNALLAHWCHASSQSSRRNDDDNLHQG